MPVKMGVERWVSIAAVVEGEAEEALMLACWMAGLSSLKMLEELPQQVVVDVGSELQQ